MCVCGCVGCESKSDVGKRRAKGFGAVGGFGSGKPCCCCCWACLLGCECVCALDFLLRYGRFLPGEGRGPKAEAPAAAAAAAAGGRQRAAAAPGPAQPSPAQPSASCVRASPSLPSSLAQQITRAEAGKRGCRPLSASFRLACIEERREGGEGPQISRVAARALDCFGELHFRDFRSSGERVWPPKSSRATIPTER